MDKKYIRAYPHEHTPHCDGSCKAIYLASDVDARIAELERELSLFKDSEFLAVCGRVEP